MKRPVDKITVVVCEQSNIDTEKIKDIVNYIIEERGCTEVTDIQILTNEPGRKSSDIIRDFLMSSADYIDIVVVGNQGADFSSNDKDKYLGSVANSVIRNTKLNCLFIP